MPLKEKLFGRSMASYHPLPGPAHDCLLSGQDNNGSDCTDNLTRLAITNSFSCEKVRKRLRIRSASESKLNFLNISYFLLKDLFNLLHIREQTMSKLSAVQPKPQKSSDVSIRERTVVGVLPLVSATSCLPTREASNTRPSLDPPS